MRNIAAAAALLLASQAAFGAGFVETGAVTAAGAALADRGSIIPSGELDPEAYIASRQFLYPQPAGDVGLYTTLNTLRSGADGYEGVLQIGLRAGEGALERAASNVVVRVRFAPEVERLETWGHGRAVSGDTVSYAVGTLRRGESVTLLCRFFLRAGVRAPEGGSLATVLWSGTSAGKGAAGGRGSVSYPAAEADKTATAVYLDALFYLAEAMPEIGKLYYNPALTNRLPRMLRSIEEGQRRIKSCQAALKDSSIFASEYNLLSQYAGVYRTNSPAAAGGGGAARTSGAAAASAAVRVKPAMPRNDGKTWVVQVAACRGIAETQDIVGRLLAVGLSPNIERYKNYYRVTVGRMKASELSANLSRLAGAGIGEVWVR